MRGKCFIEYIPAENAWNPIDADGYMYIDCLWVAGSFKGNGYSTDLLNACIEDSKNKGKKGVCKAFAKFLQTLFLGISLRKLFLCFRNHDFSLSFYQPNYYYYEKPIYIATAIGKHYHCTSANEKNHCHQ